MKPVKIVVPYAAGGPADVTAREIAQKLAAATGQSFVVDNQGGSMGIPSLVAVTRLLRSHIGRAFVAYLGATRIGVGRDMRVSSPGMAAAFMGLAIAMPLLAHATWHFYRRAIGPPAGPFAVLPTRSRFLRSVNSRA